MSDPEPMHPAQFAMALECRIDNLVSHYEKWLGETQRHQFPKPCLVNGTEYESPIAASHALRVSDQAIRETCRHQKHRKNCRRTDGTMITLYAKWA